METQSRFINAVQVVEFQGRLDAHQGKQVDQKLSEVRNASNQTVVNLSKVHFIDSTGLSVLVKGVKHQREQNGDLVLCELQQPVRIIFELTRLDRMFQIYSTEREAVQAFQ
ncbi:MAG: STAS domain-containing protein [Chloroflexi bacterium]|nr:STAS domain-containing protein [Chloroflexota bacterium]